MMKSVGIAYRFSEPSASNNHESLVALANFLAERLDFYASENRALWSLILVIGMPAKAGKPSCEKFE